MLARNLKPSTRSRKGFTLIELLVAMSIVLILVGIVFGVQRGVYRAQSEARAKADMAAIATALESFKLKYGDYPWLGADTNGEGLFDVLTGKKVMRRDDDKVEIGAPKSNEVATVFLNPTDFRTDDKKSPKRFMDPWGQPYRYYYKPQGSVSGGDEWKNPSYILISYGPDASTGTDSAAGFDTKAGYIDRKKYFEDKANNKNFDNLVHGLEL